MMTMIEKQWTITDVAQARGVKESTIRAYLARGEMPAPTGRLGRTPWWSQMDLTPWLHEQIIRRHEPHEDYDYARHLVRGRGRSATVLCERFEVLTWYPVVPVGGEGYACPSCGSDLEADRVLTPDEQAVGEVARILAYPLAGLEAERHGENPDLFVPEMLSILRDAARDATAERGEYYVARALGVGRAELDAWLRDLSVVPEALRA